MHPKHIIVAALLCISLAGCKSEDERIADVVAQATAAEKERRIGDAVQLYRDASTRFPDNIVPRRELAELNIRENNFDVAAGQLRAILDRWASDLKTNYAAAELAALSYDREGAERYSAVPFDTDGSNPRAKARSKRSR